MQNGRNLLKGDRCAHANQFDDKLQRVWRQVLASFHRHGYAVLRAFATPEEVARLRARAMHLAQTLDIPPHAHFATGAHSATRDRYFLDSAEAIRGFFEPAAFDEAGRLKQPRTSALNKIGHALHLLDETCRAWATKPAVARLARALGLAVPAVVQSQFIFKPPRVGGKVDLHMDSTFLYTDPPTCTGLWLALDEATPENGCLLAIPGSHRQALPRRYVRTPSDALCFAPLSENESQWDAEACIPLCAQPGDLVLLHGQLVHASAPNRSDRGRLAYVLHLVDRRAHWAPDNWMRRPPWLEL